MRHILCWFGHRWTFPAPYRDKDGEAVLWRGCDRCGAQQTMKPYVGDWRYVK